MGEKTKTQFQFLLKPGIKYLSLMFQKVNYLNVFLMISVKKYNLLLFKSLKYEFEWNLNEKNLTKILTSQNHISKTLPKSGKE